VQYRAYEVICANTERIQCLLEYSKLIKLFPLGKVESLKRSFSSQGRVFKGRKKTVGLQVWLAISRWQMYYLKPREIANKTLCNLKS
jgi:hypothetical protein